VGLLSDFMSRKETDAYAAEMATQFINRLPVDRTQDAKRVNAEFEILLGHARGFQRKAGLGVMGTSRLANGFQWGLIERGYDAEFARDMGKRLAVKLAESK
jgi:hypothetical protein